MKIEQLYTNCLAQGAYYIESNGEAAIIDPLREVQQYIDLANSRNATIKYIFETHFHADFVSGHVTLSEKTGAPIVYGPNAETEFDAIIAHDGQLFSLGNQTIKAIHTPGHTMESTCYLLVGENGVEQALFSGDTLFLGDVGRPDLAQKAGSMTQEDLAGILFDSLREKLMVLPDSVTIYPGHGAGSACGKNMSKETVGNLGEQKATNYALRADMTKEEFVKELTDGLLPPPAYFPLNVQMNREGYASIDDVMIQGKKSLNSDDVTAELEKGAIVLDVRHQNDFSEAHIPGSIFIGLDGQFAPWVGSVLQDVKQKIILVVSNERLEEAIIRLSRVGFDQVVGFLDGGMDAWKASGKETEQLQSVSAEELATLNAQSPISIVDVRKEGEYQAEHIENVQYNTLDGIWNHLEDLPKTGAFYVHCAGGYRSVIALSILKRNGIHSGVNVLGGYGAISKTSIPKTQFICPSTL